MTQDLVEKTIHLVDVPVRLDGADEGPLVAAPLVAALERLRGNATLRRHISWNARCFWKRHFGHDKLRWKKSESE